MGAYMHRDIGETVKAFVNCMERENRKKEQQLLKRGIDITKSQGAVIGFVFFNNANKTEVYQKDIEKQFNLRRPSATNLISRLEEKGYLKRSKDELDGRSKKLTVTEKGLSLIDVIKENVTRLEKKATKGLSKKEIDSFYSVIDKMMNNLKEE